MGTAQAKVVLVVNCDRMAPGHTLGVAHFAFALLAELRRTGQVRVLCVVTPDLVEAYRALDDVHDGVMEHALGESVDPRNGPLTLDTDDEMVEYSPHHFQKRVCPSLPAVVTCHDLHVFDIPWKYPNQQSVAQLFSDNMRTAKCILTHFPRTALHLPGHVDGLATPIVLTPSPAMLDTSRPDDAELAHARERFKITGAVPVLLYPAQLQQHKNHRNLFTALAKYTQQHAADRPPMLICPGSEFRPYHTEQLQRHAQELGIAEQVQMPGFVSDTELRSLYTLCDAVIAPSLAEGGAYIAYEAILFRKPVACSNLDSARMHLEMAHAQVPLFDPFEPAAIAQSIRLLLTQGGTLVARNELACRTINGWTFEMVAQHYLHEARACAGAAVTIPSA